MLAGACCWLLAAKAALACLPFRWLAPLLGRPRGGLPAPDAAASPPPSQHSAGEAPEDPGTAQAVGWAIRVVAGRLPWTSSCLVQAVAAQRLLRSRRVAGTLYLGAARALADSPGLEAHAWVRSGAETVTGGAVQNRFAVVGAFTWPGAASAPALPSTGSGPGARASSAPGEAARLLRVEELLLAALRPPGLASGDLSLDELPEADWKDVTRLATRLGVAPRLCGRLKARGLLTRLPAEVQSTLKGARMRCAVDNLRIFAELDRIASTFAARGLQAMPLKGAHLARSVYAEPFERPMGDLDLLVRWPEVPAAVDSLRGLGYQPERPIHLRDLAVVARDLPRLTCPGAPVPLELHWSLSEPGASHRLDVEELWSRAAPEPLGSPALLLASVEDLMVHLCEHVSHHHLFGFGLRAWCDLEACVDRSGGRFDWSALVDRARRWRCDRGTYLTLRAARDWLGTPVPDEALEALRPRDADEGLSLLIRRRTFRLPEAEIRGALPVPLATAWRSGLSPATARILWSRLFPPRQELAAMYGVDASSPWLLVYRCVRPLEAALRHARSGGRLLFSRRAAAEADAKAVLARWLDAGQEAVNEPADAPR